MADNVQFAVIMQRLEQIARVLGPRTRLPSTDPVSRPNTIPASQQPGPSPFGPMIEQMGEQVRSTRSLLERISRQNQPQTPAPRLPEVQTATVQAPPRPAPTQTMPAPPALPRPALPDSSQASPRPGSATTINVPAPVSSRPELPQNQPTIPAPPRPLPPAPQTAPRLPAPAMPTPASPGPQTSPVPLPAPSAPRLPSMISPVASAPPRPALPLPQSSQVPPRLSSFTPATATPPALPRLPTGVQATPQLTARSLPGTGGGQGAMGFGEMVKVMRDLIKSLEKVSGELAKFKAPAPRRTSPGILAGMED